MDYSISKSLSQWQKDIVVNVEQTNLYTIEDGEKICRILCGISVFLYFLWF